jgi:hypothetical protein
VLRLLPLLLLPLPLRKVELLALFPLLTLRILSSYSGGGSEGGGSECEVSGLWNTSELDLCVGVVEGVTSVAANSVYISIA